MKYKLTDETIIKYGVILYRIQAIKSFANVGKGDLGGFIAKEKNLSQNNDSWVYDNARVYGEAQVYGEARVYGEAWVSGEAWIYGNTQVSGNARLMAQLSYTKGCFIGGENSQKITNITDKTGSSYWKAQYVLGDYEISPIEKTIKEKKTVTLKLTDE